MDEAALEGLCDSIEAWKGKRALKEPTRDVKIRPGSDSCPLCWLYNTDSTQGDEKCAGCPVDEHTGEDSCYRTPYSIAHIAYREWLDSRLSATKKAWLEACDAEIQFLQSLLPKDENRGSHE